MAQNEDPYRVLLISRSATAAEIRKSFQELARKFHPDKLVGGTSSEAEKVAATEKFQRINKAYEVLGSAESRQEYDTLIAVIKISVLALSALRAVAGEVTQHWPLSATVDLDAMDYSLEAGAHSMMCRCGGSYTLTEGEMEEGLDTVCCSTCSLAIRVLYQLKDEEEEQEGARGRGGGNF